MVIVTTAVYWRLNSPLPHTRKCGSRVLLTFQHRAGVSPYTSPYGFAWTCVFSKQSLLPGLCNHHQLPPHGRSPAVAPLLPKLRGQFAEFLNHSSPDRLGILYLTTCVGFGYGPCTHSLEAFLGIMGSPTSPHRLGIRSQARGARIYLHTALHPYPGTTTTRAELPFCVTPSLGYYFLRSHASHCHHPKDPAAPGWLVSEASPGTRAHGYGNINPFSIDYACRPRLRSRLTLGGTTWPRNPWSSGGRDSHSAFATHACILTPAHSTAVSTTTSPHAGRSPTQHQRC